MFKDWRALICFGSRVEVEEGEDVGEGVGGRGSVTDVVMVGKRRMRRNGSKSGLMAQWQERKTCGGVVCAEEKQCGMFETLSESKVMANG